MPGQTVDEIPHLRIGGDMIETVGWRGVRHAVGASGELGNGCAGERQGKSAHSLQEEDRNEHEDGEKNAEAVEEIAEETRHPHP